ncbi:MFS transporter [Actinoplanes sp. KI2]|uniref:MFS transporter n=1 Tax=Actinoplanes sp. KI2 TaxID=2983315 RepID=UPI0021D601F2|nr:MFS transporter [Actinoplanes sp. KI2]MCU7724105.1 MFS transporter [Actinoplanes sp. KI2]
MSFTSGDSRWSDVYLVAGSRGVSVCGDFLAATTLALVLQQTGHGGLAVSGLLIAASLPLALLAPIAGRIADRADSRTVLVLAGLAQCLVCAVLAFVRNPIAIIGLVALLACGLAITQPTLSALIPRMVRPEDLARASGLTQTAGIVGALIAPALAGILVGQSGSRLPLLLDAMSYLALIVAGLAVRTRRHPARTDQEQTQDQAFRVRDDRVLAVMIGSLAAVIAGVNAINVFDVFFIRGTLHASTTVYGIVGASWAAGMLLGSAAFGRFPPRKITVPALLALVAGSCAPILAGAAVGSAGWLIPLWLLGGVCNGGINVFVFVIVADRAPAAAHGRAFAVMTAAVQTASLLGLLVAGPLVDHFDPRLLVAAAGALGLGTALAAIPIVTRADKSTAGSVQPGFESSTPVSAPRCDASHPDQLPMPVAVAEGIASRS